MRVAHYSIIEFKLIESKLIDDEFIELKKPNVLKYRTTYTIEL
jgi:hypothetical protein